MERQISMPYNKIEQKVQSKSASSNNVTDYYELARALAIWWDDIELAIALSQPLTLFLLFPDAKYKV